MPNTIALRQIFLTKIHLQFIYTYEKPKPTRLSYKVTQEKYASKSYTEKPVHADLSTTKYSKSFLTFLSLLGPTIKLGILYNIIYEINRWYHMNADILHYIGISLGAYNKFSHVIERK